MDVAGYRHVTIRMDRYVINNFWPIIDFLMCIAFFSGAVVHDVCQKQLETVVPRYCIVRCISFSLVSSPLLILIPSQAW